MRLERNIARKDEGFLGTRCGQRWRMEMRMVMTWMKDQRARDEETVPRARPRRAEEVAGFEPLPRNVHWISLPLRALVLWFWGRHLTHN